MSAPRCAVCHDSGSKNQTGDYLDCPVCDMPHTRKALNDFVKSLGPTHPEDVALAIHQRALAMAPKQDAPAGWKLVPEDPTGDMFRAAAKIDNEMFAGGSSHGAEDGQVWAAMYDAAPEAPIAAPAAANSALTDEQIDALWNGLSGIDIHNKAAEKGINTAYALRIAFARAILAAAGPDAAPNVEALRDILLGVIPAKMAEKHGRDFFQGEGQDEHRAEVKGFNACRDEVYDKANKAFQAALSGAKGN